MRAILYCCCCCTFSVTFHIADVLWCSSSGDWDYYFVLPYIFRLTTQNNNYYLFSPLSLWPDLAAATCSWLRNDEFWLGGGLVALAFRAAATTRLAEWFWCSSNINDNWGYHKQHHHYSVVVVVVALIFLSLWFLMRIEDSYLQFFMMQNK